MVTAKKSRAPRARSTEKVVAKLEPALVRRLEEFAARERRSRSNAIEVLLAQALDVLHAPAAAAAS